VIVDAAVEPTHSAPERAFRDFVARKNFSSGTHEEKKNFKLRAGERKFLAVS